MGQETVHGSNYKVVVSYPYLGIGVFWYAWGKVGFWWALLYGLFWPTWLGYRIAESLGVGP